MVNVSNQNNRKINTRVETILIYCKLYQMWLYDLLIGLPCNKHSTIIARITGSKTGNLCSELSVGHHYEVELL